MVAQRSPITPSNYQHYPHTTPKYIYFLLIRGDGRRDSGIGFLEYVTCDWQSPTNLGDVQNEFIADKPLPSGKSKGPVSRRRTPLQMGYVTAATDSNRKTLFQSLTLSRTPSGVKYWWCPGLGSMILCLKKIPLISTPFLLTGLMVQSKNFVSGFDFSLGNVYCFGYCYLFWGPHSAVLGVDSWLCIWIVLVVWENIWGCGEWIRTDMCNASTFPAILSFQPHYWF